MADSINPRCPVHGVRHKRPMCDPDETVVLDRPYEVGDQLDTDLDADIAASRRARRGTLDADDRIYCTVCGEPCLYGSRHPSCAEEADRG